jgi:hypothetical protein
MGRGEGASERDKGGGRVSAIDFNVYREGNNILGSYYRITAWRGASYLGEGIYAGYTRRESLRLARESVRERGGLGIYAN